MIAPLTFDMCWGWDFWVTWFGGGAPAAPPRPPQAEDPEVAKRSSEQILAQKRRRAGFEDTVVAGALSPGDSGARPPGGERKAILGGRPVA